MSKLISLTQDKFTLVDDEDYEWLSKQTWHAAKNGNNFYARTSKWMDGKVIQFDMHRIIWQKHYGEIPEGFMIDHQNGEGLDNQKKNIRLATRQQNNHNTKPQQNTSSKYKGVTLAKQKQGGKEYRYWQAQIRVNKKLKWLGYYKSEEEAALAYDEAANQYHGEFARLNF